MVTIMRVTTKWEGFTGAPGYTNLFFRDFNGGAGGETGSSAVQAQAAVDRVRTFWTATKNLFPDEVRLNIQSDVDVLEDTTGELVDSYGVTPGAPIAGGNVSAFAGPVGLVINWKTGGIRNGRRIRGRSFLVPVGGNVFATTGGVIPAEAAVAATAAAALASNTGTPDLGVWARPTSSGASDGKWSVVTSSSVPTLAAVLRSRRD